ncbi:hypothetical protein [Streptomyces sp. NPDC000880]
MSPRSVGRGIHGQLGGFRSVQQAALIEKRRRVARQVADGRRWLPLAEIRQAIGSLRLTAGSEHADHVLDWVDRFDGASPRS